MRGQFIHLLDLRSCDLVIEAMNMTQGQDDLSRKCDQCEPRQSMTGKPKVTHCYNITGTSRSMVAIIQH